MRETHVPLESVWERLVRAVKDGSKRPFKSLKGSKLRRTSNLTFLKSGLKLHTKKQWSRLSLRTIEYATNTNKKYFYTFRINQITFTYGERKKERPNFYGMFRQNLPDSAAFTAYWKWSYHNATQSECAHRLDDNIFQIDRSLVLMRAFSLLSSFWWFIKRANLIAARIYSQATEAHWKKTDVFYSPWAKCCMRNEKRCFTCASKQLHNIYVGKFLFHEGIYEEKRIRNVPLFSLHNN